MEAMSRHKKRGKTTFSEVVGFAAVLLAADVALALLGWIAILFALGILEILALIILAARATWDSLPKGVRRELRKL